MNTERKTINESLVDGTSELSVEKIPFDAGLVKEKLFESIEPSVPENFFVLLEEYERLPDECKHGYGDDKFCNSTRSCKRCFDKTSNTDWNVDY